MFAGHKKKEKKNRSVYRVATKTSQHFSLPVSVSIFFRDDVFYFYLVLVGMCRTVGPPLGCLFISVFMRVWCRAAENT